MSVIKVINPSPANLSLISADDSFKLIFVMLACYVMLCFC